MTDAVILTLNAGSSSLKVSLYQVAAEPVEVVRGQVERIGGAALLRMEGEPGTEVSAADHTAALQALLPRLDAWRADRPVAAVGHRIVHGGAEFTAPVVLDEAVAARLAALVPLAPLHQPHNLSGLAAARAAFPDALQLGCFDTAFHQGQAWEEQTFALPRRYHAQGVRRYGFHGLSYDYIAGVLAREEPGLAQGRVIVAHLGNGASMCAMHAGRSRASTMGFSALEGLAMGTRCGQIDPGVLLYLMEAEGMDSASLTRLLYRESGLLGLSGLSHDMRTLEASDAPDAAQAIAYFTHRIRREIGALTSVLGGLDGLVFTGGIGEHSARVRAEACAGMDWLGLAIDEAANRAGARDIGANRVRVLVIPTDEERVIARACTLALGPYPGT